MTLERITTDASGALESLDRAVRLRKEQGSFELALRLDDDRGSVAAVLAQQACKNETDEQLCWEALERIGSADAAIGENPLLGFATMSLEQKATVRDLALLARRLVFRSWAEMRRAVMNFDIVHHAYAIEAPLDERVPEPGPRRESDGSIVVWAPDEPLERLYIPLTAATGTGRPIRVFSKGSRLEDVADALSRAAICVAASLSDPGQAIALARWEIPLCATFTSGAYEWLDGISSYRSWSVRSVASALAEVRGMPLPRFAPSSLPHDGATKCPQSAALISIVVRARDGICDATAGSIERQTHRAIEVLEAPSAQALRAALASAKGSYVVVIRDGDILFGDSLALLAGAMDRSGADVAYGDALLGYLVDAPGAPTVFGYSILERAPLSLRAMSASDEFVDTYFRVLFRSGALIAAGLDENLDELLMYDAFLRALQRGQIVRVDEICGMSYRYADGRSPRDASVRFLDEYERVYARVPASDAAVGAARAAILAHLKSNDRVGLRPPPQRLIPPRPV